MVRSRQNERLHRTRHERVSLVRCLGEPLKRNVSWIPHSRCRRFMRRALLVLILLQAYFLAGCSFSTEYVIVNASGGTLEVTYTIAPTGIDPLATTGVGIPAILPTSKLMGREWRKLPAGEFVFDRVNRTVTVSLPPNQGLLITRAGEYNPNRSAATDFIIKEIRIAGPNGEMTLRGDAVPKAFIVVPKPFYSFGPPTLLTLTCK